MAITQKHIGGGRRAISPFYFGGLWPHTVDTPNPLFPQSTRQLHQNSDAPHRPATCKLLYKISLTESTTGGGCCMHPNHGEAPFSREKELGGIAGGGYHQEGTFRLNHWRAVVEIFCRYECAIPQPRCVVASSDRTDGQQHSCHT